jgi:hypothetical protein
LLSRSMRSHMAACAASSSALARTTCSSPSRRLVHRQRQRGRSRELDVERLLAARHRDPDVGEQLRIEQRPVQRAARMVDA